MPAAKKLVEVKERFLKENAENEKLWSETEHKRTLGMSLAKYRVERGLSQKDVAERAGWDKGFVSRLEGAQGGYPETATLERYLEACGAHLVVGVMDSHQIRTGEIHVLDVFSATPGGFAETARLDSAGLERFAPTLLDTKFERES